MIENGFAPDTREIITRGINSLLLRFPLAAFSILGEAVRVRASKETTTMATDGRVVYVSEAWIREKGEKEAMFGLLHEWFHIFLNHVLRRGDRDSNTWNIAADIIVNREALAVLHASADPWQLPEDCIQVPGWVNANHDVETVYDELMKQVQQQPSPTQAKEPTASDGSSGEDGAGGDTGTDEQPTHEMPDGSDLMYDRAEAYTDEDEAEFFAAFASEIAVTEVLLEQVGGNVTDYVRKRMADIKHGDIPWGSLLAGNIMENLGHDSPTWTRPNKRYFPLLVLPTMMALKERILIILLDVSASVGKELLDIFASNVERAAQRATKTYVITFDAVIREVVEARRPAEAIQKLQFTTGSHSFTDARPAFAHGQLLKGTAYAVLTDGHIYVPDEPVPRTVFAVPENGGQLPWGKIYKMKYTW